MRIAINGRLLIENRLEGIGYFTREVIQNMVRLYPQHDYLVLFDRRPAEQFLIPGVEYRVVQPAARHPLLYRLWFELLVPWYLRNWDAEVFLSFDGFTSRHLEIPVVTAIHDLAYAHYPESMKSSELGFYRKYQPLFAAVSEAVLTVSEYSRQDIHKQLDVPLKKIHAVYNGSRFEKSHPEPDMGVLTRFGLEPEQYFIYTGSLHPRKNILRLIAAFERFSELTPGGYKLVLAGRSAWKTDPIRQAAADSAVSNRIIFTGYIPDSVLWTLLSQATALCYISLFEGFGVPVLDALHANTPVIGSRTTSIPEVAGEAALLIDPLDVEAIAQTMKRLAVDGNLREQLVAKGVEQRLKYNWASTTRQIYDVVSKVYERTYSGMI